MERDRADNGWGAALLTALEHAIEHAQAVTLDEGMDALVAEMGAEAALREALARYERELARLFGFVRASGALPDSVAWSTLKADIRRATLDAGIEISLRTALETGMYLAEQAPLGDHDDYQRWARGLTGFLLRRAGERGGFPAGGSEEERLYWAYETLADLEDHEAFHRTTLGEGGDARAAEHQRALLALPRFDLTLNASLLWLAEHGGRAGENG